MRSFWSACMWISIQVSISPVVSFPNYVEQQSFSFLLSHVPNRELVHSKIYSAFKEYNEQLREYNHFGALLAWNISTNISSENLNENSKLIIEKNIWNNHWCGELLKVFHDPHVGHPKYPWELELQRQLYFICRGPRFSSYQLSNVLSVLGSLQQLYNKKVCIKSTGECMRMEPELNHFMERTRDEGQLREAWLAWHEHVGGEMKPLYSSLVRMLNQGARQAGFRDMGECWRAETEIDNLKGLVMDLYSDVKYLYTLIHTFVRHKLEAFYGQKFHNGLIPAHLLGNMWAQKWDSLMDIVWSDESKSSEKSSSASRFLVNKLLPNNGTRNVTVMDMVKSAEQFFVSIGLPKLPQSFWKNSYFQEIEYNERKTQADSKNCHGSAANMFGGREGDYRMMMCAQVNDEDFITLLHEIGHIQYFMAYSKLPTVFQEGANSAFHESVGDSITYDQLSPSQFDKEHKMKILLKTGLAKLPQIGFGLVMDLWRWEVFERPNSVTEWNKIWWQLNKEFLGIARPHSDSSSSPDGSGEGLDAAGKFHIIDNIPYIRYYLASFLQLQFYKGMCDASSPSWNGDLHQCQIRNSKPAGKLLWDMMEKGCSRPWSQILMEMIGTGKIESGPLLEYYKPLRTWLEIEIKRLNLTIGW